MFYWVLNAPPHLLKKKITCIIHVRRTAIDSSFKQHVVNYIDEIFDLHLCYPFNA